MNALSGRHCARGFPAAGRAFALSLPVALSLCPTSANAAPGQVVAPVALVDFAQPGPRLPQAVDVLQEGRFVVEGSRVAVARVRPGDVMTVSGHPSLELGLGYGAGPLPDGVVFHPGARSVRVPTWSDARFVVVRASGEVGLDAPARPQVARGTLLRTPSVWDALAWQRVEAEVVAWLRARSRSAPSAPSDPDLRALVAELAGLRALAERAGVSAADIAPYLVLHFQREAARLRPLRGPFHVAAPFTIKGGHPVEQDGEPWRRVDAGQTLTVDSEARVLRVAVRTLRPGRARVELSEGDRLAHVVSRDTRGDPATEWSKPSHVRLVLPPGSQAASVRVLSGSALVAVRAYRARPALLDALLGERGARSPAGSSTGEPPTAVGALRRAARYDNDRAHGHLRQLFLDERTPPAMRLALGLELSRGLDPGDPGDVLLAQTSVRLLDLVELPEVHGAALRRALLVRLWDLGFQAPVVRYGFARVPLPELPRKLTRVLAGLGPEGAGTLRTEAALLQELEQRLAGSAGASERPLGPYARATRLARQLWRALAPYRLLSTTDGTAPEYEFVPALDDRHRPDACDAWSGRMPRWTWLDRPTDIDVVAERGTHALVSIRTVPGTTPRDAAIVVNETTAVVHARVGLGARLAVRPGRHRFTPKDGPLLVRVPRAGPVACRNLRQLRRWYRPGGKGHVEFGLAPGTEPTPIRVDIRAPSGRMSTLTLAVKDQRFETWARGQVRLDVALSERQPSRPAAGNSPPGSSAEVADTFTVMAPRTVAVRVAARHNRASLRSVPQLRFAPSDPAQPAVLAQLSALRALTTAIRSTDDRERIAVLRRRRADVLRALGQATAADADLQRVGPLQATVPAGPQSGDLPAIAVALPDHVEDVVVLGLAGRLPRLASGPGQAVGPASAPDSGSGALPGLVVRGDPRAALVAANAPVADILPVLAELPPPEQVGPELLADAILALRAGMRMRAAEDYARLGRAMGAGPALARSAARMAGVAAERDDLGLSRRALPV
ncbi:MAG: hypothetical protein OXU20_19090, partial [Myxococcales bacterium]|nr:hypothetical protein [Myxococcales bacterium]